MAGTTIPGFLPSTRGLHFANSWPSGPTVRLGPLDPRWVGIGDASGGLCGGMCFVVRDLWESGVEPPPDRTPPANGSPCFRHVVRRQVQSLDWLRLPIRFYLRSAFTAGPATAVGRVLGAVMGRLVGRGSGAAATVEREVPAIRADLEAGALSNVGLIRAASLDPRRLTMNHQVVAYGLDESPDRLAVRIYDPNHPDRDDVELRVDLDAAGRPIALAQSTGEPLQAFFRYGYRFVDPGPWRPGGPG